MCASADCGNVKNSVSSIPLDVQILRERERAELVNKHYLRKYVRGGISKHLTNKTHTHRTHTHTLFVYTHTHTHTHTHFLFVCLCFYILLFLLVQFIIYQSYLSVLFLFTQCSLTVYFSGFSFPQFLLLFISFDNNKNVANARWNFFPKSKNLKSQNFNTCYCSY